MDFTSFIFWSSVFSSNQEEYQPKKPSPEHFRHLTKTNVELEKNLRGNLESWFFRSSNRKKREKKYQVFSLKSKTFTIISEFLLFPASLYIFLVVTQHMRKMLSSLTSNGSPLHSIRIINL